MIKDIVAELNRLKSRVDKLSTSSRFTPPRALQDRVQIASGEIDKSPGRNHFLIESETGTTDNLDTINDGYDGQIIILSAQSGHAITVRDGIDNIALPADRVLDSTQDKLMLMFDAISDDWCELSYSDNG